MFDFLEDFILVENGEFSEHQNYPEGRDGLKLYCQNDKGKLTHLLIRGDFDFSILKNKSAILSLEAIVLHNLNIKDFPFDFNQFLNLRVLDLDKCQLDALPCDLSKIPNLTLLSLNRNDFSEIPVDVFKISTLENLQMGMNKLDKISNSIIQLKNLKSLLLHENNISNLPHCFNGIEMLADLNLANNKFTNFPDVLVNLESLSFLDMSHNQIVKIPESIVNLKNVENLLLDNNKITEIPTSIGLLDKLQALSLDFNKINFIPESLGDLKSIEYLSLNDNKIRTIPDSFSTMNSLQNLYMSSNPITEKIQEIVSSLGSKPLIDYLLEIKKPETKPLNEAKVLVVGDERVGKTSLINRVIGRKMNINEESTLGIDIQNHPLKNGISVNFWDFAGQEITHQTHQFFLSSRSLYLYVIDAQKEDNDSGIFHWLNTIKAGAENSPIVIVVNKRDLNPSFKFDINRYKQEFNIVSVLYVSAEDESKIKHIIKPQIENSINDLIAAIETQISNIQDIKIPFPPSWLAVKNHLESLQQSIDFIESSQYENVCEKNGITDERLQNSLLSILNQIGTIVTYRNHDRLSVMQIINPEWVTNGVYKIVRSSLITETAILTKAQFKQIFAEDDNYKKERHYTWLIDLVKQFQLAFNIDSNHLSNAILIPSRLDPTQPQFDITQYQTGLNFRFQYHGILKKSVMHQFIVQMHEYVTEQEIKYWQRGMYLTYGDANAIVISDEDKKHITIAIDKASRAARELLTIIRHCLRRINGHHFKTTEKVPLLLANDADKRQIVGFESYELITEAEIEEDTTIRLKVSIPWNPDKATYKFQISDLLDGYRIEDNTKFNYGKLADDLFSISCLETESRHSIFKESEDQTNDRYKNALLNRSYHVSDQSRGGESESGKRSGERDLVVRNSQTGIAECVIEAFQLNKFDASNITKHVSKLLEKYDTVGNKHNFILVYVKSKRFLDIWKKYQELIPNFEIIQNDITDQKINVKIGTSKHGIVSQGGSKQRRKLTHFFINFYSEQS